MSKKIIYVVLILSIGLIIGLNIRQPQSELIISPLIDKSNNDLAKLTEANQLLHTKLSSIESQFEEARVSREMLSDAIDALKNELKKQNLETYVSVAASTGATDGEPGTLAQAELLSNNRISEFADSKSQVLTALGVDGTITERIQQREEKMEMDRLYLRNSAIREGWFGTDKYFEKTQNLNRSSNVYREELGDDNYDNYLYQTDQNNRISVMSVISSSPAEEAGVEKGDIILKYDNENIFSWSDLTEATTDGEIGQQVSIVIQRNDDNIEIFVPRGPLGIRLENIKRNPNS